jgi:hypothetical protein
MSEVICSDLDNYGFQVCREEPTVDSSANGQQLPDNDDIGRLFDDESEENEDEEDDEDD